MVRLLLALLLPAVLLPLDAISVNGQTMTKDEIAQKLVGAWRYVGTFDDGKAVDRGANPTGMIVYTAGGNMSVQIAPDRPRLRAGAQATPDEAKAALTGYIAYFGRYTIDERTGAVTHHRTASIQPGDAAAVVRIPEFKGERMILRPPDTKREIVWERIK